LRLLQLTLHIKEGEIVLAGLCFGLISGPIALEIIFDCFANSLLHKKRG